MPAKFVCHTCGQSFTPKHRGNPNTYCCRACHLAGIHKQNAEKRTPIYEPCAVCGLPVEVIPWEQEHYRAHYCSRACMGKAKQAIRGKDHPLYRAKSAMACEVCGTIKLVKPSLVGRFRACSRRCTGVLAQRSMPQRSSLEDTVEAVLRELGVPHIPQHPIKWYTVDFYLPERNLVIECDGSYWHSLPKTQRRDKSENTYLLSHGYRLVRLAEEEIREDARAAVIRALHDSSASPSGVDRTGDTAKTQFG